MHRTRIEPESYEIVQEIIKTNPDIKGTQAAVRHALLLLPAGGIAPGAAYAV